MRISQTEQEGKETIKNGKREERKQYNEKIERNSNENHEFSYRTLKSPNDVRIKDKEGTMVKKENPIIEQWKECFFSEHALTN